MKRLRLILLSLLAVVLVAVLLVFGLLGTGPGLRLTTSLVNSAASSDNTKIEITDLSGVLGGSPKIGSIAIADGKGVWLTAESVEADISIGRLLMGQVDISRLSVVKLAVARQPQAGQQSSRQRRYNGSAIHTDQGRQHLLARIATG